MVTSFSAGSQETALVVLQRLRELVAVQGITSGEQVVEYVWTAIGYAGGVELKHQPPEDNDDIFLAIDEMESDEAAAAMIVTYLALVGAATGNWKKASLTIGQVFLAELECNEGSIVRGAFGHLVSQSGVQFRAIVAYLLARLANDPAPSADRLLDDIGRVCDELLR